MDAKLVRLDRLVIHQEHQLQLFVELDFIHMQEILHASLVKLVIIVQMLQLLELTMIMFIFAQLDTFVLKD